MEDVLAVYKRPRDGDWPLVCLDETSKQLPADTRAPIPIKLGQPARCGRKYERNGTANLFMMFALLEDWRRIKVTEDLSDRHFPNAKKIILVQDNSPRVGGVRSAPLNIHKPASLYEASAKQSKTSRRAIRMALHAKARMARYGGVRTRRSRVAMSQPPYPGQEIV